MRSKFGISPLESHIAIRWGVCPTLGITGVEVQSAISSGSGRLNMPEEGGGGGCRNNFK